MRSKGDGRKGWGGRRSGRVKGNRKMHDGTKAFAKFPLPLLDSEQACHSFPGPQGWDEFLVHRASCLLVFAIPLGDIPLCSGADT